MIDTVLVLDVSGSMSGRRLEELQLAVANFMLISQKIGLEDRIGIVTFGGTAKILCPLTDNYARLIGYVKNLRADGSTPMAEALAYALKEMIDHAKVVSIEDIQLMPRIILMTDGEPDKESDVIAVANSLGQLGFPIACVGVTGCKESLLRPITRATKGMFVMASRIEELSIFFLQQVYLTLYIATMIKELGNLLNRELLRSFMEEATGQRIDDDTLDMIIVMLDGMVKGRGEPSSRGRVQQPAQRRITYTDDERTPMRSQYQYKQPSRGCCCTIL